MWWLIILGSIVLSAFGLYVLTASARRGDDLARQAERRARRDRALSPAALVAKRCGKEYARRYPERAHANRAVKAALKAGTLRRPSRCSKCGKREGAPHRIHAHHEDYSKPLDVVWLCHGCHVTRHRELREARRQQRRKAS